jgi:hypothetical protein
MALILDTANAPANNTFHPKIGCGLVYCLDEADYIVTAGTESFIPIIFNFFDAIFDGDTMNLHGYTFLFTASPPANLNEIQINGNFTAANVLATLLQIPFFYDNYNITQPGQYEIYVQNKNPGTDSAFSFDETTANAGSIMINPFMLGSVTEGTNAVMKEDYIVELDVFDVLAGGQRICNLAYFKYLNILPDMTGKVCFDVQKIIEDYATKAIRTSLPAPSPGGAVGVSWNGIDPDYLGQFRFRFTSKYRLPGSTACQGIIGDSFFYPSILGLRLYVVNMVVDADSEYAAIDFSYFGNPLPVEPITIHPDDFRLCLDSSFEFRVDFPAFLIQSLPGGIALFVVSYNYTDGSTVSINYNFNSSYDGIQVLRFKFGETIPAPDPTKVLDSIKVRVAQSVMASPLVTVAEKDYFFQYPGNKPCCGCHKQFYFLSKLGNNETITARCDIKIDLDFATLSSCREVVCGGEEYEGSDVFDGGETPVNVERIFRTHTLLFETLNFDFLQAFLESPVKFIYEDGRLFRIFSVNTSYQIFEVGTNRYFLEYSYRKSIDITKRHFSN